MIKAAFFDIDGTLLSFKTHRIPASAQQVLDSFHEQGIACVIATGRPTYQMPDWLFDLGWDAYITLSGQHCFDAEGVYRSCPIDPDDVAVIVDQVAAGVLRLAVHAGRELLCELPVRARGDGRQQRGNRLSRGAV